MRFTIPVQMGARQSKSSIQMCVGARALTTGPTKHVHNQNITWGVYQMLAWSKNRYLVCAENYGIATRMSFLQAPVAGTQQGLSGNTSE